MPNKVTNMQVDDFSVGQISKLIQDAKEIAVIPSEGSSIDGFCAAVGLYQMLRRKKKDVHFVFTKKRPEEAKDIISLGEITSNISQRELTVSINYASTTAAKAKYSTENDVLKVTLGPVPKEFDLSNITSEITGYDFDLVFVLGAKKLEDLNDIYSSLKEEIKKAKVVNVDISKHNSRYGTVNIIDNEADSLSFLVFNKAPLWALKPDKKAAKSLLTGLSVA